MMLVYLMLESYIFRQIFTKIFDRKQHYCGDSFRIGSFAKDCLLPLVNRISIKPLEKCLPCYTLTIAQNVGLDQDFMIKCRFILTSCNVTTMVPNKPKIYFYRDSCTLWLCWMHWFVSHLIYITKPTIQQCFHPIAKHLLYRYVIPSFAGHSFRVNAGETLYLFADSPLCMLISV